MLEQIISGGQTGVDRAALDVALELGIPCGGWCPKGRRAEDGVIPERYPISETESANYNSRTKRNVRDSDGTLVINYGELDGGTAYTVRLAERYGKPCLVIDLDSPVDVLSVRSWVDVHAIRVLNVAGPKESKRLGIYAQSGSLLRAILLAGN